MLVLESAAHAPYLVLEQPCIDTFGKLVLLILTVMKTVKKATNAVSHEIR